MKSSAASPPQIGAGEPLKHLRRICLLFPEARETQTFGNPTFQAGRKTFAVLDRYSGKRCICFKATLEEQARLCRDPRFFFAPYGGQHGWTCLLVATLMDWKEVAALVEQSYRLVATKRQIKALDTSPPDRTPARKDAPGREEAPSREDAPGRKKAPSRKDAPGRKGRAPVRKPPSRKGTPSRKDAPGRKKTGAGRKKKK